MTKRPIPPAACIGSPCQCFLVLDRLCSATCCQRLRATGTYTKESAPFSKPETDTDHGEASQGPQNSWLPSGLSRNLISQLLGITSLVLPCLHFPNPDSFPPSPQHECGSRLSGDGPGMGSFASASRLPIDNVALSAVFVRLFSARNTCRGTGHGSTWTLVMPRCQP